MLAEVTNDSGLPIALAVGIVLAVVLITAFLPSRFDK